MDPKIMSLCDRAPPTHTERVPPAGIPRAGQSRVINDPRRQTYDDMPRIDASTTVHRVGPAGNSMHRPCQTGYRREGLWEAAGGAIAAKVHKGLGQVEIVAGGYLGEARANESGENMRELGRALSVLFSFGMGLARDSNQLGTYRLRTI